MSNAELAKAESRFRKNVSEWFIDPTHHDSEVILAEYDRRGAEIKQLVTRVANLRNALAQHADKCEYKDRSNGYQYCAEREEERQWWCGPCKAAEALEADSSLQGTEND